MAAGFGIIDLAKLESDQGSLDRVQIMHDGDLKWPEWPSAFLDQAGADRMIAAFKKQGVDIPIDYHHATTETHTGRKAPAAGWITALEYVPGKGLFADVKWTEEAAAEIKSGQYRYLSPVTVLDKKGVECHVLDSVALTNKPATKDMPEILAAAEQRSLDYKEPKMKKNKKFYRRPIAWRVIAKAEELMPAVDVDVEALPEEQVEELDEVGTAIATIGETIRAAGGELADDADALSILAMANDLLGSSDSEEGETDAVAEALGLVKGSSLKVCCAEANKWKVERGSSKGVAERLAITEKNLADRDAADKTNSIKAMLESHVQAGRLNPKDDNQMSGIRAMAENDLKGADAFAATLPVISDPHRTDFTAAGDGGSDPRAVAIAESRKYWNDTPDERMGNSVEAWVNGDLATAGMVALTDAETEKLGV